MDNYLLEARCVFGNPQLWTDPLQASDIPGMERKNAFHLSPSGSLDDIIPDTLITKYRNVAVIGINPTGLAAAFQLKLRGRSVTLLPSGLESDAVKALLDKPEVSAFFESYGIAFRPHVPTALRGSQVHCQSGYCSYVCEGNFIGESEEVGRVETEAGNVFADIVILTGSWSPSEG